MAKIHIRHGITSNARQWQNMGFDNAEWYQKYGQFRSLCWTKKSSITTSDDIKDVSCLKCLNMFHEYLNLATTNSR